MAFVSVYLGLGSNLGNRLQNLTQALDLLDKAIIVVLAAVILRLIPPPVATAS